MKSSFKHILPLFFLCLVPALSNAEVIELDTQDPQVCLAKLAEAKGKPLVILEYSNECSHCQKFMPIYEKVAEETPQLPFYRIDRFKVSDEVQTQCLGEGGSFGGVVPYVKVGLLTEDAQHYALTLRSDVGGLKRPFSKTELKHLLRNLSDNANDVKDAEVTLLHNHQTQK